MAKTSKDQTKSGSTFGALAPRRNGTRMAFGALVIVLTALGSVLLFQEVGERKEVLVLAANVDAGKAIKSSDLSTARISLDPGIGYFDATKRNEVIGRVPSSDLVQGSILNPRQLAAENSPQVGVDEALVGLNIPLGQRPVLSNLAVGDVIFIANKPEDGADAVVQEEIEGRVFTIISDTERGALIDVVVKLRDAALVASWGSSATLAFRPGNQESTLGLAPKATEDVTAPAEGGTE